MWQQSEIGSIETRLTEIGSAEIWLANLLSAEILFVRLIGLVSVVYSNLFGFALINLISC